MNFSQIIFGINAFNASWANYIGSDELLNLQKVRLERLLNNAIKDSKIYRDRLGIFYANKVAFEEFPPITKMDLMNHFEEWVTDPDITIKSLKKFISDPTLINQLYLGKYTVWESSGSSGVPAIFVQDEQAMSIYDSLEAVRKPYQDLASHMFGTFFLMDRIALVGIDSGHFASIVSFERFKSNNPLMSIDCKSFSIFEPISQIVEELNQFQPTIIATYPSVASALADEYKNGALKINPHEIWTGGETLSVCVKHQIEDTFKCRIRNNYGASEFLPMTWECEHGSLHVNSDWVILEPVDENYKTIPVGEMSYTTLLTNLANQVQPLIRYDLSDSIRFHKENCQCGSAFPSIDVIGRKDDVIRLFDSNGKNISILPLVLSTLFEDIVGLFDFQLTQVSASKLKLRIPLHGKDGLLMMTRCEKVLKDFLKQQGVVSYELIQEIGLPITRGSSGKIQRIVAKPKEL